MDQILINVLNGVSSGLLLFMLSSGLTLIFSMMGVLNFAHASFYMIGAYFAYSLTGLVGFWLALLVRAAAASACSARCSRRTALRRVHKFGHVPELLITFGLSYVVLELVQLVWGRTPVAFDPPALLQGPAFTIVQSRRRPEPGGSAQRRPRCARPAAVLALSDDARLHDVGGAADAGRRCGCC